MLRQRGRVGLMAAALVVLVVGGAQAQVTTERSASILVFPRVISDGTRDTIIQITNTVELDGARALFLRERCSARSDSWRVQSAGPARIRRCGRRSTSTSG